MPQEIKVTKGLIKTVNELDKCADKCDKDVRLQKSLRRLSMNFRKHLKLEQRGGALENLQDPRIYNVQGMIETGRDIPGDVNAGHYLQVPSPFSAGNDMKSLELIPQEDVNKFIPDNYVSTAPAPLSGGGKKHKKRTSSKK
jgi:hypothetical protein